MLFGEIHEVEVDREGAGDLVGALDRERVRDRRGPLEGLGRLVGVGGDGREAQTFDVVVEAGRAAFAQHPPEERPEHAHVGAHLLGQLLLGFATADEVDGFGASEFVHPPTLMARCFRRVTR